MKKTDRRVNKTRKALQEALIALILERGYETLTVQDVLDRANVGRSTFYSHYYGLDELLHSEFEVLQSEFERNLKDHPEATTLRDLSRLVFQHARQYRNLYQAVVGKESGRMIQSHFRNYLSSQVRERINTDFGRLQTGLITREILEHHLVGSFMTLLEYWLEKGFTHTDDEMAQIHHDLVYEGIHRLMD